MKEPVVLEMSKYVKPPVYEQINKDWVLNGRNNSFWDYILDRYNGSPTNAAIVDAYIDRVYGKGIAIESEDVSEDVLNQILKILTPKEARKVVSDYIMFGSAVMQIRYSKSEETTIAKVDHLERKYVAPNKMNDKGEVAFYWFCTDWSKTNTNKPKRFDAFGASNKKTQIVEIKPYKAGKDYYADPPYLSGLQYAVLEEEIANYSVNHIMNGLSAGYILNFNEGEPAEEIKEELEAKVKRKVSGSNNAGKVIISFNNSKETAPTVEALPTNTSHEEWQLWTEIARQQIMVAHRVTSPMLFGIKDNTGLGNNANELRESTLLLHETVVRPKQNQITEVFEEIFKVNGIEEELRFIPLEDEQETEELAKEKSGLEMNSHFSEESKAEELIDLGEDENEDEWTCIMTEVVDYDNEDMKDKFLQLASTGTAIPNAKSEQDSDLFKVRYQYAPLVAGKDSRDFCKKMVNAKKVYRKEDIIRMGSQSVNPGFGPGGSDTYSIWLYKGGARCSHKWLRKTYVKKGRENDVDVNSPLAEVISTAEARRKGDRTVNAPEVSTKPRDMPNKGFL